VGGLSEATERIFRKYGIGAAVKRYKTLRNLLVHAKDKRSVGQTDECVYKIPCHNCSSTYIEETGWSHGKRQEEHRKEVESIGNRTLTWADQKDLSAETNKSAITDHLAKENHVIDWSGAKTEKAIEKQDNSRNQSAYARRSTVSTETGEPTTYQRPMTVFWSRAHRQRHVTICLKFANETSQLVRYSLCVRLCNRNTVMSVTLPSLVVIHSQETDGQSERQTMAMHNLTSAVYTIIVSTIGTCIYTARNVTVFIYC